MSPRELAEIRKRKLAAQLSVDRAGIQKLVGEISTLRRSEDSAEHVRALALAFLLERLFTAIETTCMRVLRDLDGAVPAGADWHAELLRASTLAISQLRPALIDDSLRGDLFELLKFRHFARHGYEAEINAEKVFEQAERTTRIGTPLDASLAAFEAWLLT